MKLFSLLLFLTHILRIRTCCKTTNYKKQAEIDESFIDSSSGCNDEKECNNICFNYKDHCLPAYNYLEEGKALYHSIKSKILCSKKMAGPICNVLIYEFFNSLQFLKKDSKKYSQYLKTFNFYECFLILEKNYEPVKCYKMPKTFKNISGWTKKQNCNNKLGENLSLDGRAKIFIVGCYKETIKINIPECLAKRFPFDHLYIPDCLVKPELLLQTSVQVDICIIKSLLLCCRMNDIEHFKEKIVSALCCTNKWTLLHAKFCILKIFIDLISCKEDYEKRCRVYDDIICEGLMNKPIRESKYYAAICLAFKPSHDFCIEK